MTNSNLTQVEVKNLLDEADLLIEQFQIRLNKQVRTNKSMDNLAYIKGLKQQTDKIMLAKSNLSLRQAKSIYADYIIRVSEHIKIENILSKNPNININFNKGRTIKHFLNDFNTRMVAVDLESYIKDLKRIRNVLYRELRKFERIKEEVEIDNKFAEIKNKIANL